MARSGVLILEDDAECDIATFMLDVCGIEYSDFIENERILTRQIFENQLDTLLKMLENRSPHPAPFFVIGYFFLLTGAEMPIGLKSDILEVTKWENEAAQWFGGPFVPKRKLIINDFHEKIKAYKTGRALHTIMGLGYESPIISDVVVGIKQFRDMCDTGGIDTKKHINLDGWDLEYIPTETFKIHKLESFSLQFNRLQRIPKKISQLKNLKYLDFSYNNFVNID